MARQLIRRNPGGTNPMTRHILAPKADSGVNNVVVGWDRPLRTFFAQAFMDDENDSDAEPTYLLWVGFAPGEIPTADDLIGLVTQYADIPANLHRVLTQEQARSPYMSVDEASKLTDWTKPADDPTSVPS